MKVWIIAAVACGLLAGCTALPVTQPPPDADPAALVEDCCRDVTPYPPALVAKVEAGVDDKSPESIRARMRPPLLGKRPEAWSFVRRHLQPLDILLTADKGRLSGRLLPGYFSHSLVYLGTEDQLRRAGLWSHPALVPYHGRIQAGDVFFESVPDEVGFADDAHVFDVDGVGVFRPSLTAAEQRAVLERLMAMVGTPFDHHFDSGSAVTIYCAEMVERAYPDLGLPRYEAYGRTLVLPDSIAALALRGHPRLQYVGYVYGTWTGAYSGNREVLAATVQRGWPR